MAANTLFVGDVHAKVGDLEDCSNLLQLIKNTCETHAVQNIIFLGDQYHTHSLLHIEVVDFWIKAFKELKNYNVFALVGNHDMPGNGSALHAMQIHQSQVNIIDKPTHLFDNIYGLPYYAEPNDFIKACANLPADATIVCHQEFNGCQYENGFYSKNGVLPDSIKQTNIISGHIHKTGQIGQVFYPGSPRWMSLSDANEDKSIYVYNDLGTKIQISNTMCRKIHHIKIYQNQTVFNPLSISEIDTVIFDIYGDDCFIAKTKDELSKQPYCTKIRVFPVTPNAISIQESVGISTAFYKYLNEVYTPKHNTHKSVLQKMVKERLNV